MAVVSEAERILLDVTEGNWLEQLEEHVTRHTALESTHAARQFVCCLYKQPAEEGEDNNALLIETEAVKARETVEEMVKGTVKEVETVEKEDKSKTKNTAKDRDFFQEKDTPKEMKEVDTAKKNKKKEEHNKHGEEVKILNHVIKEEVNSVKNVVVEHVKTVDQITDSSAKNDRKESLNNLAVAAAIAPIDSIEETTEEAKFERAPRRLARQMLECVQVVRGDSPDLRCSSRNIYNISLNMKALKKGRKYEEGDN